MKVVRITTTAELVAAVPWMLGYHPSAGGEAMVALTDDGPCVGCGVGGPLLVEMLPDHSYLLLVLYGRHADPGPLGAVAHDIARVVGGYVQINEGDWTELPDMSSMGWNLPPTLAEPAASREEMVASLMPEPCADLCDGVIGDLQALTVAAAADLLPDMVTRAAANKNLAAAVAYLLGVEPLFHHVVAWAGADSDTQGIEGALKAGYDAISVMLGLGYWVAEGDMYPRQIGERCQRAALAGGPPRAATVEALLRQGAQRHAIVVSKRQALSSKTVREAMTMQASTQWQRKPKGMNPWA